MGMEGKNGGGGKGSQRRVIIRELRFDRTQKKGKRGLWG